VEGGTYDQSALRFAMTDIVSYTTQFEKQGLVPSLDGDPKQIRAAMKLVPLPPLPQGLSVKDEVVPGFEKHQNSARIYTPVKSSKRKAIVI
jgi:hypothetical protein